VKDAWIDSRRADCALNDRCAVVEISVSSDRARTRGGSAALPGLNNAHLMTLIQSLHAALRGSHGSPGVPRGCVSDAPRGFFGEHEPGAAPDA
jgi:hypothetical protein